jgi:hypothetical protein
MIKRSRITSYSCNVKDLYIKNKYQRTNLEIMNAMKSSRLLDRMLKIAEESYGLEEAEKLKLIIERLSEAINTIHGFDLEPWDDPTFKLKEDLDGAL